MSFNKLQKPNILIMSYSLEMECQKKHGFYFADTPDVPVF